MPLKALEEEADYCIHRKMDEKGEGLGKERRLRRKRASWVTVLPAELGVSLNLKVHHKYICLRYTLNLEGWVLGGTSGLL